MTEQPLRISVLSLCLLLLGACSVVPPRRGPEAEAVAAAQPDAIYVIRQKWHIQIAFATSELAARLRPLDTHGDGTGYLVLGFGDRHYLASQARTLLTLPAALWPGPGLILATSLKTTPEAAYGQANVITMAVTAAQARAAEAFVWESLTKRGGTLTPYSPGPYAGSLYFNTTHDYSLVHTCNTWAAQVLQAAGLPVHSSGVIFAQQLWRQLRARARSSAAGPPVPAE